MGRACRGCERKNARDAFCGRALSRLVKMFCCEISNPAPIHYKLYHNAAYHVSQLTASNSPASAIVAVRTIERHNITPRDYKLLW